MKIVSVIPRVRCSGILLGVFRRDIVLTESRNNIIRLILEGRAQRVLAKAQQTPVAAGDSVEDD